MLEMTDSASRTTWNDYLDVAERNRGAAASLGLVRNASQNRGESIRLLAPRRIVLAFDPLVDDPKMLRTVILLLRLAAIAASTRQDLAGIETANERMREALVSVSKIDNIRKSSDSIRKSADKIGVDGDTLQTNVNRVLGQALTALTAAASAATIESPQVRVTLEGPTIDAA